VEDRGRGLNKKTEEIKKKKKGLEFFLVAYDSYKKGRESVRGLHRRLYIYIYIYI
jgi:hypothetical protein